MSTIEPQQARNDAAGGTQTATFRAKGHARMIERVNIVGPTGSTCALYVGQNNPMGFRDGSGSGAGDTGEYPTGLLVPGGNNVFLVWNSQASQATAIIQWADAPDGV